MKYAIINNKTIIKIINEEQFQETFMEYVKSINKNIEQVRGTIEYLIHNKEYEEGTYLLQQSFGSNALTSSNGNNTSIINLELLNTLTNHNNIIQLVKKIKIINKGYFWTDSLEFVVEVLNTWELYNIDQPVIDDSLMTFIESVENKENVDSLMTFVESVESENSNKIYDNKFFSNTHINISKFSFDSIKKYSHLYFFGENTLKRTENVIDIVDDIASRNSICKKDIHILTKEGELCDVWRNIFVGADINNNDFDDHILKILNFQYLSRGYKKQKIIVLHIDSLKETEQTNILELLYNGRHYEISLILIVNNEGLTNEKTMNCCLRNNANYVFVDNIKIPEHKSIEHEFYKHIWQKYYVCINNLSTFAHTIQHYNRLVLINNNKNDITQQLFYL